MATGSVSSLTLTLHDGQAVRLTPAGGEPSVLRYEAMPGLHSVRLTLGDSWGGVLQQGKETMALLAGGSTIVVYCGRIEPRRISLNFQAPKDCRIERITGD